MSKKYKNQSTNNIIRGFTLVELLAVIVILALIALITAPVVLNVIENSRDKSYRRSVDLYGKAFEKAIAEYYLDHERDSISTLTFEDVKDYIKYEGNDVYCDIKKVNSDKTVYISKCKINNEESYVMDGDNYYSFGKDEN